MTFEEIRQQALALGIPSLAKPVVYQSQTRIVLRNCGVIDPLKIEHYIATGGYSGLKQALQMTPEQVIDAVKKSGLQGRGGAGFAAAVKWQTCLNSPVAEKFLICNAHESDTDSLAGKTLLENDPHTVLEGILIAAYAIGAVKGYIYIRKDLDQAVMRLQNSITQMKEYGLLGENILNSGFNFQIEIYAAEIDFVYGEETVMVRSIEGKRPVAFPRPLYPAVAGLNGKPTLINNIETLANIPVILQKGAGWFTGYGTGQSRGTKILSLTGRVKYPGVIEVPLGIPLRQIIFDIGGGMIDNTQLKAVQVGGPIGGILPETALDTPLDFDSLAKAGAIMGSGVIHTFERKVCMVDRAWQLMSFIQAASCGSCVFCREGTIQMQEILKDIHEGKGKIEDIDLLLELGEGMKLGSLCSFGKTAPNPVLTTIRYFREEYESHIKDNQCSSR
jgi:NADH:ubiquinone oxidoreductase subunit F (NADH-binding)